MIVSGVFSTKYIQATVFLIAALFMQTATANFSRSSVSLHPVIPGHGRYLIEISGEWPTGCHPGEQKPVIRKYTGDSVVIEFETIIWHVVCIQVITPYRALVDMSEVVGTVARHFDKIDITVRFNGAELLQ